MGIQTLGNLNVKRLNHLMEKEGVEAVVSVSPENVLYTSGTNIITQQLLRERLALTVITKSGDATLIVCGIEESLAREESWISDLRTYVEFKESPIDLLVEYLKEKGLGTAKIAVEVDYLTHRYSQELTSSLPSLDIVAAEPILFDLRAIKNPEEVEKLRHAATVTTNVMEEVFQEASPGMTEQQISSLMIKKLIDQGADKHEFIVIGTGERSQIIHPLAEDIPLQSGDVLKVDFGGKFKGYFSDVARTVLVGEPTARQEFVLSTLAEIHREVIQSAKPGIRYSDLYNKCKDLFAEKGLPFFMPHIGHSLGLGLHEEPIISPLNDDIIQENVILNIEPICIDDESKGGYHIEDLVLITENGPDILTGSSLNEHPIIIK
ncbi:Xaa-Pro peptidase family protein [Bacillus shivajii]|uniref:M24 family metallopeptidase n=1 Tax=Bacillus shivajii TaxID=1983719 RepID=UPI001CFB55BC|nr:Xaa-Pro peptidase family protein [Bacillus shivajii]UCZ52906.1 Xaa-Pro peptidase family protein [Bacillus shivajii]